MSRKVNLAYNLYMAEAEGYLTSHYQRVSALLKDIKMRAAAGQEQLMLNDEYLKQFGLSLVDLQVQDFQRIDKIAQRVNE